MEGHHRAKQVQQSLIKAVELYLSERYDETGYCFVKDLTMSKDGKRATVMIMYQSDPGDVEIDRARLTELIKKQVKLRFVPRFEFIKIINEA